MTAEPARTNVLFDVWLTARATTALIDRALVGSGLSADEFAVYSVLAQGPVTPTELAEWMAAPATTVSSYIGRFDKRGHLRRVAHPGDGRSYRLDLTEQGREAHARASAAFGPVLAAVEKALGASVTEVAAGVRSLGAAVRAVDVS